MSPFDIANPNSLQEAMALLDPEDTDVRPMGGGTALMLMMKAGVLRPRRLVNLRRLRATHGAITLEDNGELHIGALATLATLEHSDLVRRAAPVICQTMRRLSNVRVRNVATVGGNLAHADPHMDLPPLLSALDAHVIAASPAGERRIPVDALITGYYETVLAKDELIVKLVVPNLAGTMSSYLKITTRSADDWPALGIAIRSKVQAETLTDCRLFVGAATDRPTRLSAAEAVLEGGGCDPERLARVCDAAVEEVAFFSDDQGSAAYKKELLRVHLFRGISALLERAGSEGAQQ